MSKEELSWVKDFWLYNWYAEIIWEWEVNIVKFDFSKEVSLGEGLVEVYKETKGTPAG